MSNVANPTIVIGIGGTGQWVLTYLKKNLNDTYGGVPDNVRLLSFDTTSEKTEASVVADKGEQKAQVGNITLGPGEYVYLGGNIRKICNEIKREHKYPQISSWLQADYYLGGVEDDAYEIAKGAGQKRPFGRMGVFYDLAMGESRSQILGRLEQAFKDVTTNNQQRQPIEIYLVCSVAGGTGSGMFIDMAHIARKIGEKQRLPFALRGFLVMPNAFGRVIEVQKILPNAFAAMRELDRFMLVFDRDYPIFYTEARQEPLAIYHSIYRSKLFDSCYLLDADRKNLPLSNEKPELGLFPSVAECLTALMDSATGDTFSQHYRNVNTRLADTQKSIRKALYSSLGTYTYILPVNDIVDRNTYKLGIEILQDYFLKIEEDQNKALQLSPSGNQETRRPPKEEALGFLQMTESRNKTQNVPMANQVAQHLQSGSIRTPEYIHEVAGKGIELLQWLSPVEQDDVVSQTATSIQRTIETKLTADVPNSKVYQDEYSAGADRIARDVQATREKLLGREESGGRKVPGDLQKGLAVYTERNRLRFRRLLMERLDEILNGVTDDPLVGKTGKLPYAQDWLWWLIQSFDEFRGFMQAVLDDRAKDKEIVRAREDEAITKQMMYDTKHLSGIWDRMRGTAVRAQDDYIAASDYLLEIERQERLYQAVVDATRLLKEVVLAAKAELDRWAELLALGERAGKDGADKELGVYRKLREEQQALKKRRDEEARVKVYQYLTDDKYEDSLYNRFVKPQQRGEILRRFHWELAEDEDILHLKLLYGTQEFPQERTREKSVTDQIAQMLIDSFRPYFSDIRQETISDRIKTIMMPSEVAQDLLANCDALISYADNEQNYAEVHNYVSVNEGNQQTFFNELGKALSIKASTARENRVTGLSNKQRCIVISTRDLVVGDATAAYETARTSYVGTSGDRRLLHNFPAEVNASQFEQNLRNPPVEEPERLLSPLLVALLEDKEMTRRFVLCLTHDMVMEEAAEKAGQNQFFLRIDRSSKRDSEKGRADVIPLTDSSERPDLIDALTNFVYPEINRDSGLKRIIDATRRSTRGIGVGELDKTLIAREESITSGREVLVDAFARFVVENKPYFVAQQQNTLLGAFRRFVQANEKGIVRGDEETLRRELEAFLDNNDDTFDRGTRSELHGRMVEFLREYYVGKQIVAVGPRAMVGCLREFREGKLMTMLHDQPVLSLEHDLWAIMAMVIYNEIDRLERLSDGAVAHVN